MRLRPMLRPLKLLMCRRRRFECCFVNATNFSRRSFFVAIASAAVGLAACMLPPPHNCQKRYRWSFSAATAQAELLLLLRKFSLGLSLSLVLDLFASLTPGGGHCRVSASGHSWNMKPAYVLTPFLDTLTFLRNPFLERTARVSSPYLVLEPRVKRLYSLTECRYSVLYYYIDKVNVIIRSNAILSSFESGYDRGFLFTRLRDDDRPSFVSWNN